MKRLAVLLLPLLLSCSQTPLELRVCADPNNLPFSSRAGQGFENRLVSLIARDLGATVRYTWWAQRRGNIRETLNAGLCDLIPGVGAGLEMLATTRPYYNSTYVMVTRADRGLSLSGFDDPRLGSLRIGVQMIGDDFSNTPPAHALARRGFIDNVRGYMVYGDYSEAAPQAPIIAAVASGEVDVAFVWGPVAGYFAPRQRVPLTLRPLPPHDRLAELPMAFGIGVGVRRSDRTLKRKVEQILENRRPEIGRILAAYHIPTVASAPPPPEDDD
jgi:mxaJ protein